MAYGTQAGVLIKVGGEQEPMITTGNIDTTIVDTDIIVDELNSGASADMKRIASNEMAANILLQAQVNSEVRGLKKVGATENQEDVESIGSPIDYLSESTKKLLLDSNTSKIRGRFDSNL